MSSSSVMSSQSYQPTPLQQLLSVATTVLGQAIDLVDNHLTSDDQLSVHSTSIPGSTIGKHLRHARDHFIILVDAMEATKPRALCYDVRSRNTPMETSLKAAKEALTEAISRLEEVVPKHDMDEPLILNAITPFYQTMHTTFGRELWFASLHCVHHWSMVRVIAGELNVKLSDDFGFAPSTLVYQGREAPLGKAKI